MYLKKIHLKNYCNYSDNTFDFMKNKKDPYKFICFFGPNGYGKSSFLEAIYLLFSSFDNRPQDRNSANLLKYVKNDNLDTIYENMKTDLNQKNMLISGIFDYKQKEYIVEINNNGFVRNDFEKLPEYQKIKRNFCYFIKSDSDLSMNKFQIHQNKANDFLKIISDVTRYKAEFTQDKEFISDNYYTNVLINKNNTKVHFKRMSAGEKKICKSFSEILNIIESLENPINDEKKYIGFPAILLIDNCEMHIYYDRHVKMIENYKQIFKEQQIFATTHSGILIERYKKKENDYKNELWIDLELINNP